MSTREELRTAYKKRVATAYMDSLPTALGEFAARLEAVEQWTADLRTPMRRRRAD